MVIKISPGNKLIQARFNQHIVQRYNELLRLPSGGGVQPSKKWSEKCPNNASLCLNYRPSGYTKNNGYMNELV